MYSAQWSHGPVVVRWPIEDTVPTFLYRAIIFIFFPLNLVLLELRSASGSSRSKKFRSALIRIRVRLTKILGLIFKDASYERRVLFCPVCNGP